MHMRLAFAVAAHLEPEILIVDEVLAVGDAQFQKKCLGKMQEVSGNDGRTILFVSHNMAAIQNLCTKSIYLADGMMRKAGDTADVIAEYLRASDTNTSVDLDHRKDRKGNGAIHFSSVSIGDQSGKNVTAFQCGMNGRLSIHFRN